MEDLKKVMLEVLDAQGALDSVKERAQSLASSCLAGESSQSPDPLSEEGRLCLHIVRDFLSHCKLHLTLSVLEPETGLTNALSSAQLAQRLGFLPQQGRPLLLQLLERVGDEDSMELLQEQSLASNPSEDFEVLLP